MKRNLFIVLASGMVMSFAACNNSSNTSGSTDTTSTTGDTSTAATTTTTSSASGDYSAFADSVESSSQAGHILNPRTGKSMHVKVNRSNGEITDATTNEPVWRYVDNRNWWVYGIDDSDWSWENMGEARMGKNNQLEYKDDNNTWADYDSHYKSSDEKLNKTYKTRIGDTKIKLGKDGDIKIKDKDGKVKYDADDNRIKTDTSKH